jgi:hypothetical protein
MKRSKIIGMLRKERHLTRREARMYFQANRAIVREFFAKVKDESKDVA